MKSVCKRSDRSRNGRHIVNRHHRWTIMSAVIAYISTVRVTPLTSRVSALPRGKNISLSQFDVKVRALDIDARRYPGFSVGCHGNRRARKWCHFQLKMELAR